eukprot:sb/3461384/
MADFDGCLRGNQSSICQDRYYLFVEQNDSYLCAGYTSGVWILYFLPITVTGFLTIARYYQIRYPLRQLDHKSVFMPLGLIIGMVKQRRRQQVRDRSRDGSLVFMTYSQCCYIKLAKSLPNMGISAYQIWIICSTLFTIAVQSTGIVCGILTVIFLLRRYRNPVGGNSHSLSGTIRVMILNTGSLMVFGCMIVCSFVRVGDSEDKEDITTIEDLIESMEDSTLPMILSMFLSIQVLPVLPVSLTSLYALLASFHLIVFGRSISFVNSCVATNTPGMVVKRSSSPEPIPLPEAPDPLGHDSLDPYHQVEATLDQVPSVPSATSTTTTTPALCEQAMAVKLDDDRIDALQRVIETAQVLVSRDVVSHLVNLVVIYPQHAQALCTLGVVKALQPLCHLAVHDAQLADSTIRFKRLFPEPIPLPEAPDPLGHDSLDPYHQVEATLDQVPSVPSATSTTTTTPALCEQAMAVKLDDDRIDALQRVIETAQVLVSRDVVSHLVNLVVIYPQHAQALCTLGVVKALQPLCHLAVHDAQLADSTIRFKRLFHIPQIRSIATMMKICCQQSNWMDLLVNTAGTVRLLNAVSAARYSKHYPAPVATWSLHMLHILLPATRAVTPPEQRGAPTAKIPYPIYLTHVDPTEHPVTSFDCNSRKNYIATLSNTDLFVKIWNVSSAKYRRFTVQEFTQPNDGREENDPLQKEDSWLKLSETGKLAVLVAGNTLQFYQCSPGTQPSQLRLSRDPITSLSWAPSPSNREEEDEDGCESGEERFAALTSHELFVGTCNFPPPTPYWLVLRTSQRPLRRRRNPLPCAVTPPPYIINSLFRSRWTGYQPIRDQYFLIRSVLESWLVVCEGLVVAVVTGSSLHLYSLETGCPIQSHTFHAPLTSVKWLPNVGFISHVEDSKDVAIMRYSIDLYRKQRTVLHCIREMGISDIVSTPSTSPHALLLFLKRLEKTLSEQWRHEKNRVSCNDYLTFSPQLQLMCGLVTSLGLSTLYTAPHSPYHVRPAPDKGPGGWVWLQNYGTAVELSTHLATDQPFPEGLLKGGSGDSGRMALDNKSWSEDVDRNIVKWISEYPQHWQGRLHHTRNRPNQGKLVPDWLITSHVT